MSIAGFKAFFNPSSIAVVGASREPGKVGYEVFISLVKDGYPGKLYPVNRKADSVEGHPCHPDLKSIGESPELVIIVVPAKIVPAVMEECAALKVKAVIIITAGFKETGKAGQELENKVVEIARKAGIRVIGPNCLGLMVPATRVNASFGGDLPEDGSLGYLSQSGALLTSILDLARENRLGFSKLISVGNKADIDEMDLIAALGDDPDTKVIAGYLESISDGNAFIREAEAISARKPILLMKSGGTGAGAAAASSHTGSLAGSETAYEAVFVRSGIIRCHSIKEQFDYARAFTSQPLPPGRRVAIITNAGGPGIMAADAVEREGLSFAVLTDDTQKKLAAGLPAAANVHNPVDVLGDALADRYQLALDVVCADPGVDAVVVILTPQGMTECDKTARAVAEASRRHPDKTVLACFMGASLVAGGINALRDEKIPQYDSPEAAVKTLSAMAGYVQWKERPARRVRLFPVNRHKVEKIIEKHLRRGSREIGEMEAKEILGAYGFMTPRGMIASTADQAVNIADQLGYPAVMKIWSPDILHKSDVGGVRVGLEDAQQVRDAFDLMMFRIPRKQPDARIMGVLVQQMCAGGREVILGMNRDAQFGPLMMFGMGGTMVEVLKDISFYLAPLTASEAKQMLMATRTYKMLKGVRGQAGVDIDRVAEGLQRLSQLVTEFPQIQELDINPYLIGPEGTIPIAVDARISVAEVKR